MTLTHWQHEDREALRALYSAGQVWSWDEIQTGTTNQGRRVSEWLANCPPPRSYPIVLPIHREGDTEPFWLAIAFSETQCEELREHLIAFVGTVGTDFNGQRASLDSTNSLDIAARQWAGGTRVFRFSALENGRAQVRTALERLLNVWRIRPLRPALSFRTTEAMLREFHQALLARDDASATNWLEQLRCCGRLNAENLLFLKVEYLAAFDRWQDIVLDPQWPMLILMRRPRRTTALLIEALWRTEIETIAAEGRVNDAITQMRDRILPAHRQLFRTRGAFNTRLLILAFLLAAAADKPPRSEQVASLLAELPTDTPERAFATAVASAISEPRGSTAVTDALTLARQCLSREDYDGAWLHVKLSPPSSDACVVMLKCAAEMLDRDIATTVACAFAHLTESERASLLLSRSNRRTWDEIQAEIASSDGPIAVDWESWLDAVKADPSWPGAFDAAQASACDWSIDQYQRDPVRTAALAKRLLDNRTVEEANVLRIAFPHLARFFTGDDHTQPLFRPVLLNLLLMLVLDHQFGREDWAVAESLALAILDAGTSALDYTETVQALTVIWEQRGEVSHLEWGLDMLDKLITSAVLDARARELFFEAILQTFHRHARRIDTTHSNFFRLLCDDLQRSADFEALPLPCQATGLEEMSEASLHERLRDKVVGIYTLTEPAGLRAKRVLERLFEGIEVRISNDHVGSDRLRAIAQEADYFIVATRSAKHAATEFIKASRPLDKRSLIYPTGKGSTSIITALSFAVTGNS